MMNTRNNTQQGSKKIMNNKILFDFEYNNLKFIYVQRTKSHSMVCTMEVHATCAKGEEFLANDDNYDDAFSAAREIFIQLNTERLMNNVSLL